ncbi:MAG: aminoglycoside phosphotransferase family protein [Gracilibacteraceae bacterium]|jgi:hypothetical protein|nr:aminoglycoside phosphotransferase family protein [Gracilibacteraceae bacterium]
MLSKYYHYAGDAALAAAAATSPAPPALALSRLRDLLTAQGRGAIKIEPARFASTLGVLYALTLDGKEYIVKTHLPGRAYYDNLIKEYEILSLLYGDLLEIALVGGGENPANADLPADGSKNVYIMMETLAPLSEKPAPATVRGLLARIREKTHNKEIKSGYNFADILRQTSLCAEKLSDRRLISRDAANTCGEYLRALEGAAQEPPVLCHGDLSNKNIMTRRGEFVFIDWEDAFWGVADYDYCYWLTFLDQRSYYDQDPLGLNSHNLEYSKALMVMIVLMKSWISVANNAMAANKVTFDERLGEIFRIK